MFSKTQNMFFFFAENVVYDETRRADEWNGEPFFISKESKGLDKTSPQPQMWADICFTLYFPNENPWV